MNPGLTVLLYLGIMLSSTALAFASQRIRLVGGTNTTVYFNKFLFLLSFVIAWIFIAFTNIGVDYDNYYYIVQQESWQSFKSIFSVEPGFGLICVLLKQFVSNDAHVVLFVFKTLSILLAFWAIYLTRSRIVVGYAVAAYMGLAYLPSFYLMSMSLVMGIIFVAMAYYVITHKYILTIILALVAAQIHNAVYLFIPTLIVLFLLENKTIISSNLTKFVVIVAYVVMGVFSGQIYNIAGSSISSFHYSGYGTNNFSGSGMMIIVLYVPLFFLLYEITNKKYIVSKTIRNSLFIFALGSLFFNVLSYRFIVVERMEFLLLSLYITFIPSVFFNSGVIRHGERILQKNMIEILYIVYLLFRSYLVFMERTTVASGLSQYFFFNPFMV